MLDTFCKVCSHKNNHGILIVGEGNFSFARDLVNHEKTASIHATSLDSKEVVFTDEFAEENIEVIASCENATIQHSIDATCLDKFFFDKTFSVIIFNFPHTGGKSNIKNCRKLLEKFFESSSKVLCSEGNVIISLCRGQGGTPVDASRGNYGNSWKVASCASKTAFILHQLLPFDTSNLKNYCTAGYRGVICQKFCTSNGLIHIFKKGRRMELIDFSNLGQHNDMKQLDELLTEHSQVKNVYASYFKNKQNLLYKELDKLISISINEKLQDLGIRCPNIDFNLIPHDSLSCQFIIYDNLLFSYGNVFDITSVPCLYDYKYSFYSINKGANITPFNFYLSHHMNFSINTLKHGINRFDLECHILKQIQITLLKSFEITVVECVCDAQDMTTCSCITDQTSMCCKPYLKIFSSQNSYNVEDIPNFIEDIPVALWTSFQPEIVVSYMNEDNNIEYKKEQCDKYELNQIERKYCDITIPISGSHFENKKVKKVLVGGRCIATISNVIDKHGSNILTLTFNSNEIFLLCYVSDLRYLWCGDNLSHTNILKHMQYDEENNCLHSYLDSYAALIKHPLCYRHDLCFWLDEIHTEEHLFECIRLITQDSVHSVHLIKVLRHEETECISYCYRMIYGRTDGPLSHEDSVKVQNQLRLFLLHKGYSLR